MGRYQKAPDIVIPPAQPAVKSIQNGSFSGQMVAGLGLDITISAVDPAKCVVFVAGSGSTTSNNSGFFTNQSTTQAIIVGNIRNATTLRLSTARASAGSTASEGNWTVVEYA